MLPSESCTHFPFHMRAISPLASAKKIQSAHAIRKSCPSCWSEAERHTHTIIMLTGISGYTVDFSWFPQGSVLKSQHHKGMINQPYCIKKSEKRFSRCSPTCTWLFSWFKSVRCFNSHCESWRKKTLQVRTFWLVLTVSKHVWGLRCVF